MSTKSIEIYRKTGPVVDTEVVLSRPLVRSIVFQTGGKCYALYMSALIYHDVKLAIQ